jgi:hypothetical protein
VDSTFFVWNPGVFSLLLAEFCYIFFAHKGEIMSGSADKTIPCPECQGTGSVHREGYAFICSRCGGRLTVNKTVVLRLNCLPPIHYGYKILQRYFGEDVGIHSPEYQRLGDDPLSVARSVLRKAQEEGHVIVAIELDERTDEQMKVAIVQGIGIPVIQAVFLRKEGGELKTFGKATGGNVILEISSFERLCIVQKPAISTESLPKISPNSA